MWHWRGKKYTHQIMIYFLWYIYFNLGLWKNGISLRRRQKEVWTHNWFITICIFLSDVFCKQSGMSKCETGFNRFDKRLFGARRAIMELLTCSFSFSPPSQQLPFRIWWWSYSITSFLAFHWLLLKYLCHLLRDILKTMIFCDSPEIGRESFQQSLRKMSERKNVLEFLKFRGSFVNKGRILNF